MPLKEESTELGLRKSDGDGVGRNGKLFLKKRPAQEDKDTQAFYG